MYKEAENPRTFEEEEALSRNMRDIERHAAGYEAYRRTHRNLPAGEALLDYVERERKLGRLSDDWLYGESPHGGSNYSQLVKATSGTDFRQFMPYRKGRGSDPYANNRTPSARALTRQVDPSQLPDQTLFHVNQNIARTMAGVPSVAGYGLFNEELSRPYYTSTPFIKGREAQDLYNEEERAATIGRRAALPIEYVSAWAKLSAGFGLAGRGLGLAGKGVAAAGKGVKAALARKFAEPVVNTPLRLAPSARRVMGQAVRYNKAGEAVRQVLPGGVPGQFMPRVNVPLFPGASTALTQINRASMPFLVGAEGVRMWRKAPEEAVKNKKQSIAAPHALYEQLAYPEINPVTGEKNPAYEGWGNYLDRIRRKHSPEMAENIRNKRMYLEMLKGREKAETEERRAEYDDAVKAFESGGRLPVVYKNRNK